MKGLRWFKCDLHLHTPESKCFRGECTPEDFINTVSEKGLEVIAITDHNNSGWTNRLKELASEKGIYLFPGVELTCSDSHVHLLVIFDLDKSDQDIQDFLIGLGIKREEFGEKEAYVDKTVNQVLDFIRERKDLVVIPAHIDDKSGVNQVQEANALENFIKDELVNSAQIVYEVSNSSNQVNEKDYELIKTEKDKRNFIKISNTVNLATDEKLCKVTFSDNPHELEMSKHGLSGIGNRYTWIKMKEKPNLESLRQAFIMSDSRVMNYYESEKNPYRAPNLWIKKIVIKNTELNQDSFEVDFSSQMTSIIGGRGTGKSSIVSFIRGILKKLPELEKVKSEFDNFYKLKPSSGRDKLGVLKKESCIELYLEMNGENYKVAKDNFNSSNELSEIRIFKYCDDDNWLEQDNDILLDYFDIEVYSQKEIFEIANEPNSLMEIVDKSIEGLKGDNERLDELKYAYETSYKKLKGIEAKEKEKLSVELEVGLDKELVGKIQNETYTGYLSKLNIFREEEKVISALLEKYQENIDRVSDIPDIKLIKNGIESEILMIAQEYSEKLNEKVLKIREIKDELDDLNKNYLMKIEESSWRRNYDKLREDILTEERKIQSDTGTLDISLLNKRIQDNSKKLENIEKEIEKKEEIEKALDNTFKEILNVRNKILKSRRGHLKEVLGDLDVRINISRYRNQEDFEKKFRGLISRDTGFSNDIDGILTEVFSMDYLEGRIKFLEKINQVRNGENSHFDRRLNDVIRNLNDEAMANLELLLPEDELDILFKQNGEFKSLTKASAGQKTSAILTYILSKGKTPLILDQPEDDLDNELIYNLIVENLKKVKSERQIIVVTHNANIPVNGDSEYIIVMDSESKELRPKICDSIDDKNIVTSICNIMEGGKSAFNFRDKKYNII